MEFLFHRLARRQELSQFSHSRRPPVGTGIAWHDDGLVGECDSLGKPVPRFLCIFAEGEHRVRISTGRGCSRPGYTPAVSYRGGLARPRGEEKACNRFDQLFRTLEYTGLCQSLPSIPVVISKNGKALCVQNQRVNDDS